MNGRYKHSDKPDKGRFSAEVAQFGAMYQARFWHEREFETVEKVREVAEQEGTPVATLSVAWILSNPNITSVILGASQANQLTATLDAAEYKLESAVKEKLDELSIEFRRGDAAR